MSQQISAFCQFQSCTNCDTELQLLQGISEVNREQYFTLWSSYILFAFKYPKNLCISVMKREFLKIYIYLGTRLPESNAHCSLLQVANEHYNLPFMHIFYTLLIKTYKNVHINQIKSFDTSVHGVKLSIAHIS